MTCIEIAELNGSAGNKDYFEKSRVAEAAILGVVSRIIQRPLQPTPQRGAVSYDFVTSHGMTGDVKIWSGCELTVELEQNRNGRTVPGWFKTYMGDHQFVGLLTVNCRYSDFHGQEVFKLRWIKWPSLINWVLAHGDQTQSNSRGSYMRVDPTKLKHVYIGDFFAVNSKYGSQHKAFDTSRIFCNTNLNIQELNELF